jgi:hypothetical protein
VVTELLPVAFVGVAGGVSVESFRHELVSQVR